MKNVASNYVSELIDMFDIFEVLNGAMASLHNRMVRELITTVKSERRHISMVGGSDAHTLKHVGKVYTVSRGETIPEFLENIRRGDCFAWGEEMRFRDLVSDIYLLILAYYGETRNDFASTEYSGSDKATQLVVRLAGIPTAISGIPAAITSINYLKQIVVSKGMLMHFPRLMEKIRGRNP